LQWAKRIRDYDRFDGINGADANFGVEGEDFSPSRAQKLSQRWVALRRSLLGHTGSYAQLSKLNRRKHLIRRVGSAKISGGKARLEVVGGHGVSDGP
jgi:hypothetical protein